MLSSVSEQEQETGLLLMKVSWKIVLNFALQSKVFHSYFSRAVVQGPLSLARYMHSYVKTLDISGQN